MMLVPYFLLTLKSFGYLSGLGANPVETIIHETGLWGLRFLMLTLLLTPIAYYSKIPSINKLGKPVGLMAFFYLLNHFLTYAMIDQAGDLGVIIVDIIETPYLIVGWGGFLCLLGVASVSFKRLENWFNQIDLRSVGLFTPRQYSVFGIFIGKLRWLKLSHSYIQSW